MIGSWQALPGDAVDALAALDAFAHDLQSQALTQGSRDGAANAVRLPLCSLRQIIDRGALAPAQQLNQLGLLGLGLAGASPGHGASPRCGRNICALGFHCRDREAALVSDRRV